MAYEGGLPYYGNFYRKFFQVFAFLLCSDNKVCTLQLDFDNKVCTLIEA